MSPICIPSAVNSNDSFYGLAYRLQSALQYTQRRTAALIFLSEGLVHLFVCGQIELLLKDSVIFKNFFFFFIIG